MAKKKINYEQMYTNLSGRTIQLLGVYADELERLCRDKKERPDLFIGMRIGEILTNIREFKREVRDFKEDELFLNELK